MKYSSTANVLLLTRNILHFFGMLVLKCLCEVSQLQRIKLSVIYLLIELT
jgi:hypothetical protein